MEAVDGRDLRKKLDEKGYFITEYSEEKSTQDILSSDLLAIFRRVNLTDVSIFSWQLYTMLNSGLPLIKALKIIINQTKDDRLKEVITGVCQRVEEGTSFSEALKEYPQAFPRLYVQVINAGEVGGVLDEMLKRMAVFYEEQVALRAKIKSALTYPILLMMISIGVVTFLVTFVLPQFATVFEDMGIPIPMSTRFLLGLSVIMREYWYGFLALPIVIGVLVGFYIKTEKGRFRFDQMILKFPIVGTLIKKNIASQFTRTLSTLLGSGITILTALDVVTGTIGNKVVTKMLKGVSARVGEGKPIAQPLEESGIFPEMVVSMIRVGEETGSLDEILEKVAQFYIREVDNALQTFTKLLEPLLLVFMAVVVGFIAVSIFLPLTSLMTGVHIR